MSPLFTPAKVGPYALSHRVVMAPLTRMRVGPGNVRTAMMVEYCRQRASGGRLIVGEASLVSRRGNGYAGAAGLYGDAQITGWRQMVDAVHAKDGRIFARLWHVGRQSHRDLQPDGDAPVAPPAIQAIGQGYSINGPVDFSMPGALETH